MYFKKIVKKNIINLLKTKLSKKDLYDLTFPQLTNDSLIVYSSGKAATSSIRYSLEKKGLHSIQTHNLNSENLNILKSICTDKTYIDRDTLLYIYQNLNLIELVDINKHKIIVPYRDPLSVLISSFFNSWENLYKKYYRVYKYELIYKDLIEIINFVSSYQFNFLCINKIRSYHKKRLAFDAIHSLDWYEKEFNKVFYKTKNKENILFLNFYNIEDWKNKLSKFTNKKIVLYEINRTSNKKIGELYRDFIKKSKFEKELIDLLNKRIPHKFNDSIKNKIYDKFS